jgi:hypothetical protein
MGSPYFPLMRSPSGLRPPRHGFPCARPYTLGRGLPSPRGGYPPASPHRLPTTGSGRTPPPAHPKAHEDQKCSASPASIRTVLRRYGNINPLSIDYACRPRLRSRLTQGGLTWPWNPWSFGGRVSHPSFATHACILTRVASTTGSPRRFTRHTTLPYPSTPLDPTPHTEEPGLGNA